MDQTTPAARTQLTSTPSAAPGDAPAKAVTPFHSTGCALVIGIDDYRVFDPSGQSDLKGSAHDTVAIARCCTVLGMKAEDIHVLRDDVESAGNPFVLPPLGKTTQAAIHAELDWLREQLDAGRKGLLWYSGHGAHTDRDGLLLCPSDTTTTFANTIPFKELAERLGPSATKNLTVVLDCCHGGPAVDKLGRRSSTLGGDPITPGARDEDMEIGAVVLAACAPGQQTQQSWFSALPHGAFSWALLSTANQWQAQQQGGNVRMDLDYATLMAKASELLRVLEFEGIPQLYGPPGVDVGKLAALQIGNDPEVTSQDPDAIRKHLELDPNMHYTLGFSHSNATAVIDTSPVTSASTTSCLSTEYWTLNAAFLTAAAAGTASGTLTLSATTTGPRLPTLPGTFGGFAMPTNATWQAITAAPTASVWYARHGDSVIALDFSNLRAAATGSIWSGTLTWYVAEKATPGSTIFGRDDTPLELSYGPVPSSDVPAGATWSKMDQSPLTWSPTTSLVPRQAGYRSQAPSSLAALGERLYLTCNVPGVTTVLFTSSDGSSWTQGTVNNASMGTALAALGTNLFGAYVVSQQGNVVICDMLNSGIPTVDTRFQGVGAALVGLGSTLYLVASPAANGAPSFTIWTVGATIVQSGSAVSIGTNTATSPTLAVFNGKLYLAVTVSPPSPAASLLQVWWYNPSARNPTWQLTTGQPSALGSAIGAPQLVVFNNRLYLAATDGSSKHVWLCSTASDGATEWSGFQDLALQLPKCVNGASCPTPLAALGSSLVLACGDGTDVYTVQTLVT